MSTYTRFTFLLSPFAVILFALLAPAARRPALWLAILLTLLFSGCDLLGIGIGQPPNTAPVAVVTAEATFALGFSPGLDGSATDMEYDPDALSYSLVTPPTNGYLLGTPPERI